MSTSLYLILEFERKCVCVCVNLRNASPYFPYFPLCPTDPQKTSASVNELCVCIV